MPNVCSCNSGRIIHSKITNLCVVRVVLYMGSIDGEPTKAFKAKKYSWEDILQARAEENTKRLKEETTKIRGEKR